MASQHSKHLLNFPDMRNEKLPINLGKPGQFTWRDYLLMLLDIDAGIEHALMVQYLYAAYSLGGPQVPPDKREMVRRWQQTILSIAKEEMGHLITVQNAITLMGGVISMERNDYPWDHEFYPFPFELEPLTLNSLAKYVYAEAPEEWNEAHYCREICDKLQHGPTPPKDKVKSVGALFKTILAILKDPNRITEDDFHPETYAYQAEWAAWSCNHGMPSGEQASNQLQGSKSKTVKTCPTTADVIIVPVATRDDMIEALEQVAEQGEAPKSATEESHFHRFLKIYQEYKQHFPENSPIKPYKALPVNPTTFDHIQQQSGDLSGTSTQITHPISIKWANLFDLRYRLLLTFLTHTFRLARGVNANNGAGNYQAVMHNAFKEMYNLKSISDILTRSPLHTGMDNEDTFRPAGPTFQMPYSLELPASELSCWLQYRDIFAACKEIRAWLFDWLDEKDQQQINYLHAMENIDNETLHWLDTVIEAHKLARSMRS
ncbi:ferritin-like domain-containing protein [Catenovulum sediminis]|uniref:ferritin-like domain-containing protein n=1 Tax=Catenovulum sediminis TaxID=1740262 RepID=UPI00117D4672|nr:ferritin-like domain-containing protein [Catenovulum sediminis]